jgi:hypothetical protein
MPYYLNLFSPETYETFSRSSKNISGFRLRQLNAARRVHPSDRFLCYMTKLSRWVGVLEVRSDCFVDETPFYYEEDDPFVVRFQVQPVVWLDKEKSVPIHEERGDEPAVRESIRMQALLGSIGEKMGFKIWLPKGDRGEVLKEWQPGAKTLLDVLPLNYDLTTLKTLEQIDVLWLKKRAIVRAFEVEHTTAVYSGILRMADLLSLQPNMDIKLHLVAPAGRREKVFQEIQRPVFSLLEKGPLAEFCTFISYDSLLELSRVKHLAYLSDSVLEEYAEMAE